MLKKIITIALTFAVITLNLPVLPVNSAAIPERSIFDGLTYSCAENTGTAKGRENGYKFKAMVDGEITSVKAYVTSDAVKGTFAIRIFRQFDANGDYDGSLIGGPYTVDAAGAANQTWPSADLTVPLQLKAEEEYVVSAVPSKGVCVGNTTASYGRRANPYIIKPDAAIATYFGSPVGAIPKEQNSYTKTQAFLIDFSFAPAHEPVVPTPTPEQTPEPFIDRESVGYGTSFSLYPSDRAGVNISDSDPLYARNSDGGVVNKGTSNLASGPYVLYDTSKDMNSINGTANIYISNGSKISKSNYGAVFNRYNVILGGGSAGSYVEYIPTPSLLKGVETKLGFMFRSDGNNVNSKGLDAVIKYDGGKIKTVEQVVPDGLINNGETANLMFTVGDEAYLSIESVKLVTRGTGSVFMPSLDFVVVNDNPGAYAPPLPYRRYIQPDIETVTPDGLTSLPVPVDSPLYINEVCSNNKTVMSDAGGIYPNLIEIYNSSEEAIDISGYGISDNINNPMKRTFPAGSVVPAGGYLTVFASNKYNKTEKIGDEIRVNLGIAEEGEVLTLRDKNRAILDIVKTPALKNDTSFARVPDGSGVFKIAIPTIGSSNDNAEIISKFVAPPEFSHESGFYNGENGESGAFDLTLTSGGGTIYYTTDGSMPDESKESTYTYQLPVSIVNRTNEDNVLSNIIYSTCKFYPSIKVKKSMIVRAKVVDLEGGSSEVVTKSYFVDYRMKEDFNNVAVLSVVTDAANLYDPAAGLFTNASSQNDTEIPGHIDLFERNGSLVIDQDVGITLRGFGSATQDQKGLVMRARSEYGKNSFDYPIWGGETVSFVDGTPIESFKNFAIKAGDSRSRDRARYFDHGLQGVGKDLGIGYVEGRTAVVFLNGEYWGQYYIQERISNKYIRDHYGVPEEDIAFIKNHSAKSDIEYSSDDKALYEADKEWLGKTDFTKEENRRELERKFDLSNMMTYFAANAAVGNIDYYNVNFASWRTRTVTDTPYQDGKWRFIMNDLDASYGGSLGFGTEGGDSLLSLLNLPYTRAMLTHPELREEFINTICDVFSYRYNSDRVLEEMKYWQDELQPLLADLEGRWGFKGPATALASIKTPIDARVALQYELIKHYLTSEDGPYLKAHMKTILNTNNWTWDFSGKYAYFKVEVNDNALGSVQVNSIKPDFLGGSYTGIYFTDITQKLTAEPKEGYRFAGWTVSDGTVISSETEEGVTVKIPSNGSVVRANFERIPSQTHYIGTAAELTAAAEAINSSAKAASDHYMLTDDIELTGSNFTAMGTDSNPFTGIFDGNYHTINGINISASTQGQGLFGYVGTGGVVKNVGVTNITVNSGNKNVGGIAGRNYGIIENCYSAGSLRGESTVGGIVGNNTGPGKDNAEGPPGKIINCYSIAEVSGNAGTRGGIAGKTEYGAAVINCYSLINPVAKTDDGSDVTKGYVDELTSVKTAEEFADGTVTYLLNEKGTKSIWYNGDTAPVFKRSDIELKFDGDTVKVDTKKAINGAKLIIACYEGEKMTGLKIVDVTTGADTVVTNDIPENFSGVIKAFLWDGTEYAMPVASPIKR